jgi:pyruvate dehydrogenase E2 component (dihydrolipoamide acetyltransferase)
MPKLGLTMKTGTIVKWLKNEGDTVAENEPILEIETEKLNYSIESPAGGVLLKKLAVPGEKYEIARVLGYVGNRGDEIPAGEEAADAPAAAPSARTPAENAAAVPAGERVFISPVARKLAAAEGIDFKRISGSGPNGRIVKADVLQFSKGLIAARNTPASTELIPYAGMRRTIGENMRAAWIAAPMVTYHARADVTYLTEFREMLNNGVTNKAERVSVNDLILKITATALKTMPVMNALLTDEGIVRHSGVQLGMATVIDGGLLVPVIRDADRKSLLEISREAKDLAARARLGRLLPDEMSDGTFTVSNIGGYDSVDFFTPIVNAPQVGILGVGRVTDTVVAVNGEVKICPMLGLSLTCDHRVIDGAVAAEFMRILVRLTEKPARAVL